MNEGSLRVGDESYWWRRQRDAISLPLLTLKSKTNVRHQMCALPSSLAFGLVRLVWIFKSCLSHPSDLCNVQLGKNVSPPLKTTPGSMLCNRLHFQRRNSDSGRNKGQGVCKVIKN